MSDRFGLDGARVWVYRLVLVGVCISVVDGAVWLLAICSQGDPCGASVLEKSGRKGILSSVTDCSAIAVLKGFWVIVRPLR